MALDTKYLFYPFNNKCRTTRLKTGAFHETVLQLWGKTEKWFDSICTVLCL